MIPALALILGFVCDLIFGDPYRMPHPVRLFGRSIHFFEKHVNRGKYRVLKGILSVLVLIVSTYIAFYTLTTFIASYPIVNLTVTTIFVFFGLANRMLIHEVFKVNNALTSGGLQAGRHQLKYIVGRDTANLNEQQIRTASLETLSENLSDGVIAPLFYFAIGGLPLMFTYKMINTLDSMIGYKNERYKHFGMFAAKVDDICNFIPARITALLIAVVSLRKKSFSFIFKYGRHHASPNAGYPEAALAGALDCRFGGPNEYFGTIVEKEYIGNNARNISDKDVSYSCMLNIKASIVFLLIILLVMYTQHF